MTRLGRGYPVNRVFREHTGFVPVTFDAVGVGAGASGGNCSWNHTVAAGAGVLVVAGVQGTGSFAGASYGTTGGTGGTPMTLLANLGYNNVSSNGQMAVWFLNNVAGGTKQITVTTNAGGSSSAANSASYLHVGNAQVLATTFGTTASGNYGPVTINCSNAMTVVAAFGSLGASAVHPGTFSGGTERFNVSGNFSECPTWLQDSINTGATFSATSNGTSDVWSCVELLLSGPVPR